MRKSYPDISMLVPHRPPSLLLEDVIAFGDGAIVCRGSVPRQHRLARDGGLPALMAIEYMAQTIAVYAGLEAHNAGQPVRIGMLVGCRELMLECRTLPAGSVLRVGAKHIWGETRLGRFECSVEIERVRTASAILDVAREDASELL